MCIIINKSRRYLSWIEGLTTNQNVIGSNPIRRTNWVFSLRKRGLFLYGGIAEIRTSFEARASRKRGAFLASGRVRRQAGEAGADPRSGCAESYTPHQLILKLPATGAFLISRCVEDRIKWSK